MSVEKCRFLPGDFSTATFLIILSLKSAFFEKENINKRCKWSKVLVFSFFGDIHQKGQASKQSTMLKMLENSCQTAKTVI